VNPRRSALALVAVSLTALTACGASPPPAEELAFEAIDSLDVDDAVKACMRAEIEGFSLTDDQAAGFENLDDVAAKAAGGNELAQNIIDDLEAALTACN
jgi:hypothetical protein